MLIADFQRLHHISLFETVAPGALPRLRDVDEVGPEHRFANALEVAIEQVNDAHAESGRQLEAFIAGEQENLHEVMISMNQARLGFQLMVEVRNKLVDAYHELFRIQI
jgi:flagellar hook-basal body complex protein FliE